MSSDFPPSKVKKKRKKFCLSRGKGLSFCCVFCPYSREGNFELHSTRFNYSSFYGRREVCYCRTLESPFSSKRGKTLQTRPWVRDKTKGIWTAPDSERQPQCRSTFLFYWSFYGIQAQNGRRPSPFPYFFPPHSADCYQCRAKLASTCTGGAWGHGRTNSVHRCFSTP